MEAGSDVENYELSRRVQRRHKAAGVRNGSVVLDADL